MGFKERLERTEWRLRLGRFLGMDGDTEDRPQVMPVREPPVRDQTHRLNHERSIPDFTRAGGDTEDVTGE